MRTEDPQAHTMTTDDSARTVGTPTDGHTTVVDVAAHLPAEWDDIDHAIYDARVRRRLPWRDVAVEVGMASFSACRRRFYRRMAAVEPAEIVAMRAEENAKLDDREQRLRLVFGAAMAGQPIRYKGEPVFMVDRNGERQPVMERDLVAAVAALRAEDAVARARYKLNGLEAPTVVHVTGTGAVDEIEAAVVAYNLGRIDATADAAEPTR
jgi:hypothetical protein